MGQLRWAASSYALMGHRLLDQGPALSRWHRTGTRLVHRPLTAARRGVEGAWVRATSALQLPVPLPGRGSNGDPCGANSVHKGPGSVPHPNSGAKWGLHPRKLAPLVGKWPGAPLAPAAPAWGDPVSGERDLGSIGWQWELRTVERDRPTMLGT